MSDMPIPVFDGHNDTLLRLAARAVQDPAAAFAGQSGTGHIDLPRARAGGFVGGLFAAFPPPVRMPSMEGSMRGASYDMPFPDLLALEAAQESVFGMFAVLLRLERAFPDDLAVCRSVADIRTAVAAGRLAAVMHMEGAEAIDPGLATLDVLHAAGLRSLGLVWSRPNIFAHGVPFRFPSSPDTGDGLTDRGVELVRACNARRIVVDLSHLNEKGFWDVARLTTAPLVASHSNVHALCPSARNLTDRQLDAIKESRGLVGLNFATCFLRPDGAMRADTDLDLMVRHIDALVETLGEDGVGFGSDFDGAVVPAGIGDVAGLPHLVARLRTAGYGDALVAKICAENWLSVLERSWA
ncbi:dipeptidase [Lichenihabitans sp. Uapishka_5]|uniref:dipeptidase n=1 Tax=Lichenihabitans sp. Uapishka_5 TaxID=3037302 RepID=UPI0029E7CC09|nr:dipeptidase [Lichenihabitans sp. Uapishka_5]MDX7952650.1 dipeptidase [Lichenihabitans sp. Uapishka_5]